MSFAQITCQTCDADATQLSSRVASASIAAVNCV